MTNILLVEDEPLIAEEIRQTLRPAGYEVIDGFNSLAANDSSLAAGVSDLIGASHVSIVLMDINLAGKFDGVAVGKQVHEKSGIPVIFLTGYSDAATLSRAIGASPSGYLIKPVAGRQLLAQIELTLNRGQSALKHTEQLEGQAGLWNLTLTGDRIDCSFGWLAQFRYLRDAIENFDSFSRILHVKDSRALAAFLKNCRSSEKVGAQIEYRIVNAEGHERWILTKILKIENESGATRISAINFDISEQKQKEILLQHRATHDVLTGLCNRGYFMAELQRQAETRTEAGSYGVLFADLDKFKPVNDQYGHAAGDRLLIEVAQRFQRAVKKTDVVARFGGDEFVFLIRGLKTDKDLEKISSRILRSLAEPVRIDDKVLKIGCSIGGTTNTPPDKKPTAMLQDADIALYTAKKDPRDKFRLYEENGKTRVFANLMNGESLRNAIKQDQFTPHFCPIMNFTGKSRMAGLRIEMNWNHPLHGSIPFVSYREAAEDSGLIVPITLKIMEKALAAMRGSGPARLSMPVFIHLNRRVMLLRDWPAIISMASEQYTEAGVNLVLELDEAAFHRPVNLDAIRELQGSGVNFSLSLNQPPHSFQAIAAMPFSYVSFTAGNDADFSQMEDFCAAISESGKKILATSTSAKSRKKLQHLCQHYIADRAFPLISEREKKSNTMAEKT